MASNSSSLVDGDGQSSDWIEIFNPTSTPIDLTGWHLTDDASLPNKWSFPNVTLSDESYLIVFASGQATSDYVDPSGFLHTTFKLGAGGEYLGLTDALGSVVHEYAPAFPQQTSDISYGLDASEDAVYFTNPTPGSANDFSTAVSRKVSISEVMYHPASNVDADEYIEIYNGDSTPLNLSGWSLGGAVKYDFSAYTLQPDTYVVIASDTAAFSANYPSVTNVVGGWQGTLSNSTETLLLTDELGIAVDRVTYADQGNWAVRERGPLEYMHEGWVWSDAHDGGGSSLEVVNLAMTNNRGQNWLASTVVGGTPGAENSVADADDNVAPLIVDIAHQPVIPSSADTVIVTARLIDEAVPTASGAILWRVDGTTNYTTSPLRDDGLGADSTAGDGLFTGEIPAQADGAIVEWYLTSLDADLNTRTFPTASQPDGLQQTNLLYQVDDSFDPNAVPAADAMPEYRLIMTEAERAELQQIGSNSTEGNSHAQMNGTFVSVTAAGVDIRYNVGIRNRGRGSRNKLPNSYHVNLPSDATWQGIDSFNLNTQYTPLQLLGLGLYADTGLVAEDAKPVVVQVNGTNLSSSGSPAYGVYVQIEANDRHFANNHFPDDSNGNLYRITREGSDDGGELRYLGSDPSLYYDNYEKKTNASQNDYSDLIHLIEALNLTSDADYFQQINKVINVDQWLGYFATIAILGSEETMLGTGYGDDVLLYSGEKDPRFLLIPHDFDTILGEGDATGDPQGSIYRAADLPSINRFLTDPQISPLYHAKLRDLLETTFAKDNFDAITDQLLTDFTPADLIADMKSFMDARREFILGEVTQSLTVNTNLTISGGFASTTQDIVGLSGTAPLADTQSVLVNGQLAEFDPFAGQWSLGETLGGTTETFIDSPHVWDFLDAGQVPSTSAGSDWRVDDPGWTDSGASPLGYGGNGETTSVAFIDTDPDTSGTQKNITTYFRTTFDVTDVSEITSLLMRIRRDDGAVVYLNGEEVERPNMPTGIILPTTQASSTVSGSDENTFFEFALDPLDLINGENVIAVELHQVNDSSSDTIFDMELIGTRGDNTSLSGLSLNPGVNQVVVQAYDGQAGSGNLVDSTTMDVWYDDGDTVLVSGDITTDTTWTAANGPYVVTSDLTVSDGTLTIEPGTTVFFNSGVGLTVSGSGRVVAEGGAASPQERIRLSHNPALGTDHWDGLTFSNSLSDNRFRYVDLQSGDAQGNAVDLNHSRVLFDYVRWFDINNQVLDLIHPTLVVSNSDIPAISGDETIHLVGLDLGEQLEFNNNTIGKNTSGNDVVDMAPDSTDRQPVYFRNNQFLGGYDDGVDTDGMPVVFENNSFIDFHLVGSRPTTSNAISTGRQDVAGGETMYSELTIIGNTFFDVDHGLLLKDFGYANVVNNTFVNVSIGGIQFQELDGSNVLGPGLGADLDGNIFWETPLIFEAIHEDTQLTLNRSIVTADLVNLGVGNLAVDPLLADPSAGDFSLAEGSPAFLAGPNDSDIGAIQAPHFALADATNLKITELHYNPLHGTQIDPLCEIDADGDLFEFVELVNPSSETIDLSHVAFVDGIRFEFSWGTTLSPGERIVLVKNLDIFESRYGESQSVVGSYDGQLSNSGESIELRAANGGVINLFSYGDSSVDGWSVAADGSGPSLVVVNTEGDYNTPSNWTASANSNGSPGFAEPQLLLADFDQDADIDGTDFLAWQRGFGMTSGATPSSGDANGDGAVDNADLAIWEDQYGGSDVPLASSLSVASISVSSKSASLAAVESSHDAAATLSTLNTGLELQPLGIAEEETQNYNADALVDVIFESIRFSVELEATTIEATTIAATEYGSTPTEIKEDRETSETWLSGELLELVFG